MKSLTRLKNNGWTVVAYPKCGQGHVQRLFGHQVFPGVFLLQTCAGELERCSGELVQVTRTEFVQQGGGIS